MRAQQAAFFKAMTGGMMGSTGPKPEREEDTLDEEVHEILKGYQDYMRANGVEYADMFEKIKRKLVQERRLIL